MHPILEPLVTQLPVNAISRKLIESGDEYLDILGQLASEGQWCKSPETVDNDNKTGILYLEQNTNDLKGHLYLVPVSLAKRKSTS